MSFGQPISVQRRISVAGQTSEVRLAPFDFVGAEALFPVPADDPVLPLLPPSVQAERTAPYTLRGCAPLRSYEAPNVLSWGVYTNEQLIGAAALQKRPEVGGIDLDIHLAGAYRGTGASELVLAGLVRATFTRGYIANQNPEVTASERPWKVTGWAHKGNQPLRSLLRTFGFTYDSARTLEPGYRAGGFGLVGGLIAGPNENTAQTAATMKAAKKLDQFQVRASGPVKIADKPVELFERLGYKELRS